MRVPQPISACYSEAPTWKYFGEVDAQNKFQGRSFEIRPTGVAHAELMIPKKWVKEGLDYPDAGPEYGEGYVVEHYSCVLRWLQVMVLTGLIGGRKSPRTCPTSSWVRRSLTITAISLSVSGVADFSCPCASLTSQPTIALVKPAPLRSSPEAGEGGMPLRSRARCRTVPAEPLGTLLAVSHLAEASSGN
jgi:hypothetical protein